MTPDEHLPTERHGRASPPRVPASDEPVMIGSGLRDVEVGLRTALRDEADRIIPGNRLDAILAAGRAEAGTAHSRRRWLLPVAAAAAAAVVVGGALVVGNRPTTSTPVVGGPATSTTIGAPSSGVTPSSTLPTATDPSIVPTESASPPVVVAPPYTPPPVVTSPTTTPPTTSPAPPAVTATPVPVYYVGTRQGNDVLFREFVTTDIDNPVSPTTKVVAAVRTAMGAAPDGAGYQAEWKGIDLVGAEVTADGIHLELSRGLTGLSVARSKVAVQQLVWTATAAAAPGPLQVTFSLADGGDAVAPGQPVTGTYTRPTDAAAVFALLSPLWIDNPTRGQVLPKGAAVTVTGLASTNEANVAWQLLQGATVVSKGAVTAAKAAPERGGFTIPLGALATGNYVIRVYEVSAKDGSVSAEQQMPFTVR